MEDARIRAFSRSLGSKIRTLILPFVATAAIFGSSGVAQATPTCINLGAGDPMTDTGAPVTDGNDLCVVTGASTFPVVVDALGSSATTSTADRLRLDGTAAFSFDLSRIGTDFTNFEQGEITGTVALSGTNTASLAWANHGFVTGNFTLLGSMSSDGTLAPGTAPGAVGTITINGLYTSGSGGAGHIQMDVDLAAASNPGVSSDFIHVTGNGGGGTFVDINQINSGTAVKTTGNGILLMQFDGTASGSWALSHPVVSGAYQYLVVGVSDFAGAGTPDGLFLQSILRNEFYGNAALLSGGQAVVRSCFRSDQRMPDATRGRDSVRFWGGATDATFETGTDSTVPFQDQMYCANGGFDIGIGDGMRFGVVGGYGRSAMDVATPTGTATLDGSTGIVEALISIGNPRYFLNVTGGYATTSWDWTEAGGFSTADATQRGLIGSAQAGATVNVTPFRFKFIGAVNYDHTRCGDGCLVAGMTEDTGILEAKGTIRVEAMTQDINPYVAVSFSDDISGDNTIMMNGESLSNSPGHSLLQLNAGFNAPLDDGVVFYGDFSVIDGMGNSTTGYSAAGGFKAFW